MSIAATNWAWATETDPTAKLVLLALADHAGGATALAWPSVARLVEMTGLSERAVQQALRRLEAGGKVARATRPGGARTNAYELRLEGRDGTTRTPAGEAPAQVVRDRGERAAGGGCMSCAVAPAPSAPEPSQRTTMEAPGNHQDRPRGAPNRRRHRGDGGAEPAGFAAFYAAYPRRQARRDAAKAFPAAVEAAGGIEALMDHLRLHRFNEDPRFIPFPATWLRGRRWRDEQPPAAQARSLPAGRLWDWFGTPEQPGSGDPPVLEGEAEIVR